MWVPTTLFGPPTGARSQLPRDSECGHIRPVWSGRACPGDCSSDGGGIGKAPETYCILWNGRGRGGIACPDAGPQPDSTHGKNM